MAKKFHLNQETGKVSPCRAFIGKCKFGDENHALTPEELHISFESSMQEETLNSLRREPLKKERKAKATHSEEKLSKIFRKDDKVKFIDKLNISYVENHGDLVDRNYFSGRTVSGVINHRELTEDSYTDFGFTKVDENFIESRKRNLTRTQSERISALEVSDLTERERTSTNFFTTSAHTWFNGALIANGENLPKAHRHKKTSDPFLIEDEREFNDYVRYEEAAQTEQNVQRFSKDIDSAIEKSPKTQRIVYRGVHSESPMFEDYDTTHEWIDENASLGQEVKFDGYQSTTLDPEVSDRFAGIGHRRAGGYGLTFEILTPEGLNISSISNMPHEAEVMLPRQSRYMVVGVHKDASTDEDGKTNIVQLVAINEKGEILDGTNASPKTTPFST